MTHPQHSRVGLSHKFKSVLAPALLVVLSLAAGVTVAAGPLQAAKAAPDGPIGELVVENVTHKRIAVSWSDVGSPEGYVLSWWKKGAKNKTRVDVPVDGTRYTIKGLKPDKEYVIRVFTVKDGKRHGKYRSELLTQRTLPAPAAQSVDPPEADETTEPGYSRQAQNSQSEQNSPPPEPSQRQIDDSESVEPEPSEGSENTDPPPEPEVAEPHQDESEDDMPTLTIVPRLYDSAAEGRPADFHIVAHPYPPGGLAVQVEVTQVGGYAKAKEIGTRGVYLGMRTTWLSIDTYYSAADEADGSVTARLLPVDGYRILNQSTTIIIKNDPTPRPVVTVTADRDSYEEGQTITFRFDVSPKALPGSLLIHYEFDHPWRFFRTDSASLSGVRQIWGNHTEVTHTVTSVDDDRPEQDGTFTLTLKPHPTGLYTLGAASSVSGSILDNDSAEPVVSITRVAASVTEGSAASFTVTASPHPDPSSTVTSLTVPVTISQQGDVLDSGQAGERMVTVPLGGSVVVSASTDDDSVSEPLTLVHASLADGDGYTLDAKDDSAYVKVMDNDPKVTVSIRFEDSSITEGSSTRLIFDVSQSPLPYDLPVAFTDSKEGDFFRGQLTHRSYFTLPKGFVSGTAWNTLLRTVDDNIDEPDGAYTLTLDTPHEYAGYVRGDPQVATVTVLDND
ncbi:MAG: fibronectin type III domain-containing protein [Acidimicrobiia bacterium]|nr:fibronectin type III domain-containing protein [Acidimicrobiia bacterium]MYJ13180.1 fibronectin type III domain-containing protein [Acidimicrobiia bacterium]